LNYLITGGSGFIGSHLALKLSKKKNSKIFLIDKVGPSFKRDNIFFIKANIAKYKELEKINEKLDYIFHLAADLGVKKIIKHPILSLSNNLKTTENIIKLSKKKKIKRLFFFSTSEVYSLLNLDGNMSENDNLILPSIKHPRTSYWLAKVFGEFQAIMSKVPYTIFRVFNIYGTYMKSTHVIPSIFNQLKNKKNPIFQNPNHSRCFLYIDDGINIMVDALKSKYKNQIINVANSTEEIKIKNLVYKIKKILNNKKKITFKNVNNQSILRRKPNINKIIKLNSKKIKFTKLDKGLLILKKFYGY
jgi:nucleoside-diphosphate-sugar epimerase